MRMRMRMRMMMMMMMKQAQSTLTPGVCPTSTRSRLHECCMILPHRICLSLHEVYMISLLFWSPIPPISSPNLQQTKMLPQTEVSTSERLADVNTSSKSTHGDKRTIATKGIEKNTPFAIMGKKLRMGKTNPLSHMQTPKNQSKFTNSLSNWWKIKGQIPPKAPFGPGCPFKLWRYYSRGRSCDAHCLLLIGDWPPVLRSVVLLQQIYCHVETTNIWHQW